MFYMRLHNKFACLILAFRLLCERWLEAEPQRIFVSERANEQKYERISEWMQWVTKVKILGKVKWKWARISVAETPISTLETPISFWKAYLNWFIQTLIRTKRACFGFILHIPNRVLLFLHRNTLFTRELLGVDKPINKAKLIFVYFFHFVSVLNGSNFEDEKNCARPANAIGKDMKWHLVIHNSVHHSKFNAHIYIAMMRTYHSLDNHLLHTKNIFRAIH